MQLETPQTGYNRRPMAFRLPPDLFPFGSRSVLVRSSFVSRSSLVAYSLVYRRPIENRTRIERISNERRTKEDRENDGKPSKTWRETVQFDGNGVSERGSLTRLAVCPCPFQCYGMGWGVGRVEASSQWCGQSVGKHGMCATPQYGGLSDIILGSDTRQRGWFSVRGEFPYLHWAGNMPLHGGNQLYGFSLTFQHQDGRPHQWQAAAHRHLWPADEERRDNQPQQVRARTIGKWEVVLHEPPRQTVLWTRHACGLGGYLISCICNWLSVQTSNKCIIGIFCKVISFRILINAYKIQSRYWS